MREIVLDTETTGLDPATGHRVVEIGALELLNHLPTGQTFHVYINPDRDIPPEAEAVHGLSQVFLSDKPRFPEIAAEFLSFIGDATLVIHNASFDIAFLNAELSYIGQPPLAMERVIDSLHIARQKHPGGPNSLDALCRRYGVDNSKRSKHGALLDSELLAEVYLELIGGRQTALMLDNRRKSKSTPHQKSISPAQRPNTLPSRLTTTEIRAHHKLVAELGLDAVWKIDGT